MLAPVDRVQRRLLRVLGLTDAEALQRYNLAPLTSRRDIAMLGLLHRVTLGDVSEQIRSLFPKQTAARPENTRATQLGLRRHQHQFAVPSFTTDILKRSIFGLIVVYNLLPARVVESKTVKVFQSRLQSGLRKAAALDIDGWQCILAPYVRSLQPASLISSFRVGGV